METVAMGRTRAGSRSLDARKVPVMRTLARHHECDVGFLYDGIEVNESDLHETLREMISENEVEASHGPDRRKVYSLTSKGWDEYLGVLSSIYELTE